MNKASTIGMDLAKQVLADATGAVVFQKRLRRSCNYLHRRRRVKLRWKPPLLRIIGAVSFPALAMKFVSVPQLM
jgi:hypothetical protein